MWWSGVADLSAFKSTDCPIPFIVIASIIKNAPNPRLVIIRHIGGELGIL